MNIKRISNNIILLEFDSRLKMCKTLLRFSEYSESIHFAGKIFTIGEYREWYIKENGAFTYYDDWDGFNIESNILKPFLNGLFDPLTKEEIEFLDLFKGATNEFYIIAVCEGSEQSIFTHELCHAIYGSYHDYKYMVNEIIKKDGNDGMHIYIEKMGYHARAFYDECNAYIVANVDDLRSDGIIIPTELEYKLKDLFQRQKKEIGITI